MVRLCWELVEYRCKKIYFCAFGKKQQVSTVKTAKPFKLSCYRPSNPKTVEITKGRSGRWKKFPACIVKVAYVSIKIHIPKQQMSKYAE
jgi:hypothetical protein